MRIDCRNKWKRVCVLLLITGGAVWHFATRFYNSESQTVERIIEKREWDDSEMARCWVQTFFSPQPQSTKEKVLNHLKRRYDAMERPRQLNVVREETSLFLDELIAKYREISQAKRQATVKVIEFMLQSALKNPRHSAGSGEPEQKRDPETEKIVQEEFLLAVGQKLTSRDTGLPA